MTSSNEYLITLVGAGRLATQLAKALQGAGHRIASIYSRTCHSAHKLHRQLENNGQIVVTDHLADLPQSDVYIIAVTDTALAEVLSAWPLQTRDKVVLHTAGSLSMDMLKSVSNHYGVLYPMQTFSKERELDFSQITCFIEANDATALETVTSMANAVSRRVELLSSDDRKYLHLAAVFACNFSNHCFALAAEILKQHHMSFDVMLPLIDETVKKVHQFSPRTVQTGPAVRYDENVIRQQSQLLRKDPLMKDLYDRLSLSIHKLSIEQ